MRKALILMVAGIASLAGVSTTVQAADGCGAGWHRNDHDRCRPNGYNRGYYRDYDYGPGVVIEPEIGRFYPGRGYWDGDRYYWHRRYYDGDWRYW